MRTFAEFVLERVLILNKRKQGHPAPWTLDIILQGGQFCNIDRREDFVTRELIDEVRWRSARAARFKADHVRSCLEVSNVPMTLVG